MADGPQPPVVLVHVIALGEDVTGLMAMAEELWARAEAILPGARVLAVVRPPSAR